MLDIGERQITWQHDQASIDTGALTNGIYVIRPPVPAERSMLPAPWPPARAWPA